MLTTPETRGELRFACTQCGACCNRSPEVALSEAAALADVFVFRLMFRLYELPRTLAGYLASGVTTAGSGEEYYESKRLLAAFAARKYSMKRRHGGKTVDYRRYLTISALTLDAGAGACAALSGGRCGIYARRPLACRTVPFHYSRPEASAERALKAFVETPGYGCDTSVDAPVVFAAGRIVDPEARRARSDAIELAGRDRRWEEAILRRLKTGSRNDALPSLREIEAEASFGATTVSMRVAWQIAAEAGVIGPERCRTLIAAQAAVIDRELASASCTSSARETLGEMRAEYLALLGSR
jgi:Fe-S-cluster containining protein